MNKNLFIIGPNFDRTPVVKDLLMYMQSFSIVNVVTLDKSRTSFFAKAFFEIFKCRKHCYIYFVGPQTLPNLILAQFFLKKKSIYYWSLESNRPFENFSLALKLLLLEKLLIRKKIILILPIEERKSFYGSKYDDISVLHNAPLLGRIPIKRILSERQKLRFVFYGQNNEKKTFIKEWISFIAKNSNLFSLDIIGNIDDIKHKYGEIFGVNYVKLMPHSNLIKLLKNDYHFSVVGYKPIHFNTKFCAPNKFYESLSLSLPVIAHSKNPTLYRMVKENNIGCLVDFNNLEKELNLQYIVNNYDYWVSSSYKTYIEKYNLNMQAKVLNSHFKST